MYIILMGLSEFLHFCRKRLHCLAGFVEEKAITYANYARETPQSNGLLCTTLLLSTLVFALLVMEIGWSYIYFELISFYFCFRFFCYQELMVFNGIYRVQKCLNCLGKGYN